MMQGRRRVAGDWTTARLERRELLRGGLKLGVGLGLVGLAPALGAGCEVQPEGPGAIAPPPGMVTTPVGVPPAAPYAPDEGAEIVILPHRIGDVLEDQYAFIAVERAPDKHLRVRLRDVLHGGQMEIELFRREATNAERPVAATARWELYLYNSAKGSEETPPHVADVVSQVALNLAEREESPQLVALVETVCTFAERRKGPPPSRVQRDGLSRPRAAERLPGKVGPAR